MSRRNRKIAIRDREAKKLVRLNQTLNSFHRLLGNVLSSITDLPNTVDLITVYQKIWPSEKQGIAFRGQEESGSSENQTTFF